MPLAPLQFPSLLKGIVNQFQAYLADPANACIVKDDQQELGQIFVLVSDIEGDFNYHLKYHPQLLIFVTWYYNKYNGMLAEVSRNSTTHINLLYAQKRENGYGEWDAKRQTETDRVWLEMIRHQDRLQRVVNILKSLVDACKERLPVLQSLSNNYRAELREDKSTI
jgi:hypothetical protein